MQALPFGAQVYTMVDIDPAALSRSDTIPQSASTSLPNSKANGVSAPLTVKTTKTLNTAQRIDLEPLYASLKAAIGDNWGKYKEALSFFILGMYHQTCPRAGASEQITVNSYSIIKAILIKMNSLHKSITMSLPTLQPNIFIISLSVPSMETSYGIHQIKG